MSTRCTPPACRFFFFSSRRRHTRSDRDWSSDVCSSDLRRLQPAYEQRVPHHLAFETGEILALRRPARTEQLRERVLTGELVPMAVVFAPEVAHHAPHGRGQHDDVK